MTLDQAQKHARNMAHSLGIGFKVLKDTITENYIITTLSSVEYSNYELISVITPPETSNPVVNTHGRFNPHSNL